MDKTFINGFIVQQTIDGWSVWRPDGSAQHCIPSKSEALRHIADCLESGFGMHG